jgi:hypothetical protein
MRLDRIVIDILDWVRRSLWAQRRPELHKPYEVIETKIGRHGRVKRVSRDTPRAVRTWTYIPFKKATEGEPYKIHICCDSLEPLPGQTRRRRGNTTHRISIFKASRFLDSEGSYDSELLFQWDADLQGNQPYPSLYAVPITDKLALTLLTRKPQAIAWPLEFVLVGKEVMGGHWNVQSEGSRIDSVQGILLDETPIWPDEK